MVRLGLNNLILGGGNMLRNSKPCTTALTFWSSIFDYDNNQVTNKIAGVGNAALKDSYSLTFDGSDDRIELQRKISYFDYIANPFTIEFYIYVPALIATTQTIISNYYFPDSKGFYIAITSAGKIFIRQQNTATTNTCTFTFTDIIATAQWVKVRLTYDGLFKMSSWKLYYDEIEHSTKDAGTDTLSLNIHSTSTTTTIGCYQASSTPTYSNFLKSSLAYIKCCSTVLNGTDEITNPDIINLDFSSGSSILSDRNTGHKNAAILKNFDLSNCYTSILQSFLHSNISNGFTSYIKSNNTSSSCVIADNRLKNFGTSNKFIYCEIISDAINGVTNDTLFGCYKLTSEDRYMMLINSTGNIRFLMQIGGTLYSVLSTLVVSTGILYKVLVNINRSGNIDLYVNGVLENSTDISSKVGVEFNSALDFRIFHSVDSSNVYIYPSNQSLRKISIGEGLIATDNSVSEIIGDIANLVAKPGETKMHDTVNATDYTITNTFLSRIVSNKDKTYDSLNNELIQVSGNYHNGAETKIDFTNGGANASIPATYNAVSFNSVLTNPYFYRKSKSGSLTKRNDRFLIYDDTKIEPDLSKINKYVKDFTI